MDTFTRGLLEQFVNPSANYRDNERNIEKSTPRARLLEKERTRKQSKFSFFLQKIKS